MNQRLTNDGAVAGEDTIGRGDGDMNGLIAGIVQPVAGFVFALKTFGVIQAQGVMAKDLRLPHGEVRDLSASHERHDPLASG